MDLFCNILEIKWLYKVSYKLINSQCHCEEAQGADEAILEKNEN